MMKNFFKKTISLFLVLSLFVGIFSCSLPVITQAITFKNDICSTVNANINEFKSKYNYWINTSNENKKICDKITYNEAAFNFSTDTAVSIVFTLIPGYGEMKWVDWLYSRGMDTFMIGIYHAIVHDAKTSFDIGNRYCSSALNKYNSNKNSRGEITDPAVACDILVEFLTGFEYYSYGNGFFNRIISSFVEETSNKKLYVTKKLLGVAINAAIKAASPAITKMLPELPQICGLDVYEFGDLYGVLTAANWKDLFVGIKDYFNDYGFNFEKNINTYKALADTLYKNTVSNKKVYASLTYNASPAYGASEYKTRLCNVTLSGNQRNDLVNVALSQVGYHEGNDANQLDGTNIYGSKNYTEYGYWFGRCVKGINDGHFYAWCAMFISWCARQAKIPTSIISNAAYAKADGASNSGGYSYFHIDTANKGSYTPIPGDIIFFGNWDHVGIVYKVQNGYVYSIEGNTKDKVAINSYSLSSSYIKCYGIPKYGTSSYNYDDSYNYYNPNTTYPTGVYTVTAKSGLNTRSAPSASSARLGGLSYGTTVEVTSTNGNWGYTKYGWICLDYARYESAIETPIYAYMNYTTGNYVVTANSGLNIRRGAGTKYGVIKAISKGIEFAVTEVDGAWGYSPDYDGWLCLNYAQWVSDLVPALPTPEAPILTTETSSEIGVGDIISVKWNSVDFCDGYNLSLIDKSTGAIVESKNGVTGTEASFVVPHAGTFDVSIVAVNSQHTSRMTKVQGITAKAPSTVTFKDWNGNVLGTQQVGYGKDATLPQAPTRIGHTFTSWSGKYTNIKEDSTVTAQYKRNTYTVTFYDQDGTTVVNKQNVLYEDAATAPSYTAPTGYTFVRWDKDFSKITDNLTVKPVNTWTSAYPLEISTNSAIYRNNTAYITTAIVNNSPNAVSNAKVIVALKTAEGKQLAEAKSRNISLAAGEEKTITLTATYDGAATVGNLFVVKADDENIPLAKEIVVSVNQGTAWSSWSTSTPPADALDVESRTEYRARAKNLTTSSSSTMDGWTQYDHTYVWGDWSNWSSWQDSKIDKITSEEVETQRDVKTQTVPNYNSPIYETRYNYKTVYHYWRYASKYEGSGSTSYRDPGSGRNYYTYTSDYELEYTTSYGTPGYKRWYSDTNFNLVFSSDPYTTQEVASSYQEVVGYNNKTQYSSRTRNKIHTYYFYQWDNWSDWGTTKCTANDDCQVETRTTYRYISNNPKNIEDKTGTTRTITGKVNTSYAGKQALLHIYTTSGATQYLGQTTIASNGAYSYSFKLKEEPTATSGDYIVAMSIEGTTTAFMLDPILAPVPSYTVTFKNYDGSIIQTQQVKKGENAVLPTAPTRTGYDFIGWSSTGTNIQANTTIIAQFKIKTFDVVFVDNLKGTREVKTFKYGDKLVCPELTATEVYDVLGWDAVMNGITTITESLVVTAKYKIKEFTVNFYDYENNLLQSSKVAYGDGVEAPYLDYQPPYVFIAWDTGSTDLNYITNNADIYPIFEYDTTVETPVASIETGSFNTQQTVTLSCETAGAKIFYTTDGSDPLEGLKSGTAGMAKGALLPPINGKLYTKPFVLDSSATLVFVAVKDNMNNSDYEARTYAINTPGIANRQHLVTIHSNIDENAYSILVDENNTVDLGEQEGTYGYTLAGVYTNAEKTISWDLTKDKVTSSMDIYLVWEKNTYEVTFLDRNNNVLDKQDVAFLEGAISPMIPEVDGYVFSGWDNGFDTIVDNTTVKATYIAKDELTSVSLSINSLEMKPTQTSDIVATVTLGKNSKNNHVIWQSSDEDVVTVDDSGHVTAVADGEATIFAVSEDSGDVAVCEVSVYSNCKHDVTGAFTPPTCTEQGYTTFICSKCGYSYKDEYVPAIGHYDDDGDGYCDSCDIYIGNYEPDDQSANCSCNHHKSGIVKFFWKILNFFHKLFGMKQYQYCACGEAHW